MNLEALTNTTKNQSIFVARFQDEEGATTGLRSIVSRCTILMILFFVRAMGDVDETPGKIV